MKCTVHRMLHCFLIVGGWARIGGRGEERGGKEEGGGKRIGEEEGQSWIM